VSFLWEFELKVKSFETQDEMKILELVYTMTYLEGEYRKRAEESIDNPNDEKV
jgi:hypothetical protein